MIELTEQQLQDINDYFQWQTGIKLPDNRILGNKNVIKERSKDIVLLEKVFRQHHIEVATICEFGCAEGYNTVELAQIAQDVITTDVRPRNLIGAMIRAWILGLDNIEFILSDLNKIEKNLFILDRNNIVFHTGTLYHLDNPIKHLQYIASITNNLYLSTRCYDEDAEIKSIKYPMVTVTNNNYRCYKVYEKENRWKHSFAGVKDFSVWLHKDDIADILRYVGFTNVELLVERRSYCPKVIYKATK